MIDNFVLIWILLTSGGVATGSAEFATKANCEFAMQQVLNSHQARKISIGCYPK